ncbi:unnamed protein product [Discula destructiva]
MNAEWLRRYTNSYHQWQQGLDQGAVVFYRPLGIVESAFDADGTQHEGRADVNMALPFQIKTTMSSASLRRHIVLAWTCLRLRHALLCAAATPARDFMSADASQKSSRFFVVRRPLDQDQAIASSEDLMTWLHDTHTHADADELYDHAQNTARTFDPEQSLVRIFILPVTEGDVGSHSLRFLFTIAHQITDGLTGGAWGLDFMRLLNRNSADLEASITPLIETLHERLPIPQEDLYMPVAGSLVRQRWFWAITLVLRHVQKAMPTAFQNPLRFAGDPKPPTVSEPRLFEQILDYSRPPALNAGSITAIVGREGTRRLHRLCRQAGCSIGAGGFVLVAIVMMEIYERRFPDVRLEERRPFIGSFPINPRQFFNHTGEPDSVMLAFSDGIVLPFLPSALDLDGRFRLLVRSAQRQLSRYQKRKNTAEDAIQYMGARGAGRLVPMNYLDIAERANSRVPEAMRMELDYMKHFPKQANPTLATCGVSSVGKANPHFQPGQYDLSRPLGKNDLVADTRGQKMNVRPRDGEFLVGIWGTDDSIQATVSYDACAIDAQWAARFEKRVETLLDSTLVTSRI